MITKILVPVDGSDSAKRAVTFASEIARKFDARLTLVEVLSAVPARQQLKNYLARLEAAEHADEGEIGSIRAALGRSGEDGARGVLDEAAELARQAGVREVETLIEDGDPAHKILQLSEAEQYDLIVMGRRGLSTLGGLLMGSVSRKIISLAHCPVITLN